MVSAFTYVEQLGIYFPLLKTFSTDREWLTAVIPCSPVVIGGIRYQPIGQLSQFLRGILRF